MPTINVLSKNKKHLIIFHLKVTIFTAVKYCCILYGRVCVMVCTDYAVWMNTEHEMIEVYFDLQLIGHHLTGPADTTIAAL